MQQMPGMEPGAIQELFQTGTDAGIELAPAADEDSLMKGFPSEDLREVLGPGWAKLCSCFMCLAAIVLICVLVPTSLEAVDSAEVALPYDVIHSTLGDDLLREGLNGKPTFGTLIRWPITNQKLDLNLSCNSFDAIQIDLSVDFLYLPEQNELRDLTLKFINWEGYQNVVFSVARSSVRNACGRYTAREFQTKRADVAKAMEDATRFDLGEAVSARVLTLNLRNIDRPAGYQDAVSASEAALADIELAKKEREQKLIMAGTVLASAQVEADKILNKAITTADIMVERAVQQVTEGAKADTILAKAERLQSLTRANTTLETARITAGKIAAAAATEAEITRKLADEKYRAILDKYDKFGELLLKAQRSNSFTSEALLAYLGNTAVGNNKQKIALDSPAQFSYRSEL